MIVEKQNGWYIITDIIFNTRVLKKYLYYTKAEAIKLFKNDPEVKELRELENENIKDSKR